MKGDTAVTFVSESKVTRTGLPEQKDPNSGDETDTAKKALAVTVGEQKEQGTVLIHFIRRGTGVIDRTALYTCSTGDLEVMNYLICIRISPSFLCYA